MGRRPAIAHLGRAPALLLAGYLLDRSSRLLAHRDSLEFEPRYEFTKTSVVNRSVSFQVFLEDIRTSSRGCSVTDETYVQSASFPL